MKLKDCLTHDGATARNAEGLVVNRKDMDESSEGWEPLMSESEFLSRHLVLRKLGEGEELNGGCSYVMKNRANGDLQTLVVVSGHPAMRHDYDYYELPPLPPAESEEPEAKHVPMERVGTKRVRFTDPTPMPVRKLEEPAPEPNPVGERLTTKPAGEDPWVVVFKEGKPPVIAPWGFVPLSHAKGNVYRWLGPIPQEPQEPEKPEPPKWLGAVRRNLDGRIVWVAKITGTRCEGLDGNGEAYDLVKAAAFTLAPDIMPPSPELAALFAEEVK